MNVSLNDSVIDGALNEIEYDMNTSEMSVNDSDICAEKNLPLRKRKVVDISDICTQKLLL